MKKLSLRIVGIVLICMIVLQGNIVIAASKSELNNSKNETNKKIEEAKEDLKNIKNEKSAALQQVENLTGQISDYESQIKLLDNDIAALKQKIQEAETNLQKTKDDYQKQEELLNARLVATYEAGETSYLDFLLSSDGITDFISNYYLATELATYDAELLDKIQKQKEEIERAKTTLENSKRELDTSRATKKGIATQLQASKSQKDAQVAKLSEEEKQTQADLDQFVADQRRIQAELAAIAKKEQEEANKGNRPIAPPTSPSKSGFIFPVAGLSKANINNKHFPSYPGHTGTDININVHGKTIVAAKDGVVQRSMAYIRNGRYYSYGECIVINHGGGLATLYGHGLPNSRRVTTGQKVKQGQAIMTVGTTGNSTGEHLHFEVLKNGIPVNPLPYLP